MNNSPFWYDSIVIGRVSGLLSIRDGLFRLRRMTPPSPLIQDECYLGLFCCLAGFLGVCFLLVGCGLRGYLFTDRDRERLGAWLESGVEDDGTRMLFVSVRRNLNRITGDVGLLAAVARRLQEEGRWMGRTRLPGRLGVLAGEIEGKTRLHGRRS